MACSKVTFTFILTTWKVKFILFFRNSIISSEGFRSLPTYPFDKRRKNEDDYGVD